MKNNLYIFILNYFCRGLDVKCTDTIDENIQQKVLNEIEDVKRNDPTLCFGKSSLNTECKPILCTKPFEFKSLNQLGKWLIHIYDNLFNNYEHGVIILFQ